MHEDDRGKRKTEKKNCGNSVNFKETITNYGQECK